MATVTQTEYKLDVAEITVTRPVLNELTPYKTGVPIKLTWRAATRGRSGVFYGYFDHMDPQFIRQGGAMDHSFAALRCYGTSYPLKNEGFNTYNYLTADAIAKDVARQYSFSFVADPSKYVWPNYTQAGRSAWAFLVELAQRVGYTLYTIGTTLYFVDRRTAGGLVRVPSIYQFSKGGPSGADHIIFFNPTTSSGDGLDINKSGVYSVNGISTFSGKPFTLQSKTTPRYGTTQVHKKTIARTVTERAPTSIGEAQVYTNAAEALSLFTMEAQMAVRGNGGLAPGGLISIIGNDARYRQFLGTWYICEVQHNLKPAAYTTTMTVATDAAGSATFIPKYGTLGQHNLPPTALNNGIWQTRWAQ